MKRVATATVAIRGVRADLHQGTERSVRRTPAIRSEDSATRLNIRHGYNLGPGDYDADDAAVALLQLHEVQA